jgi:tetratricopeptide (TPR) repeat protein
MPSSGSTDIPHVTVHDHYIRKPISKKEKEKIKTFIGLYAINDNKPSALTKAWAYINQYNKFDAQWKYLDSAQNLLKDKSKEDVKVNLYALLQLQFSRQNFVQIINYVNMIGEQELFSGLNHPTYNNIQAWAAYQIAESFYNTVSVQQSVKWLEKACQLAPYNLEFRNKLGSAYMNSNRAAEAKREFKKIIRENPNYVSAYTNLGFVELSQNNSKGAQELYDKAMKLDADYEPLLFNVAGLKAYQKDYQGAIKVINGILKKNPENQRAKKIMMQLKSMI